MDFTIQFAVVHDTSQNTSTVLQLLNIVSLLRAQWELPQAAPCLLIGTIAKTAASLVHHRASVTSNL